MHPDSIRLIVAIIFTLFLGLIVAAQLTDFLRKKEDARKREIYVFRTLMATRFKVEFNPLIRQEKRVLDCWKLYLTHLFDKEYPGEYREARRRELLINL